MNITIYLLWMSASGLTALLLLLEALWLWLDMQANVYNTSKARRLLTIGGIATLTLVGIIFLNNTATAYFAYQHFLQIIQNRMPAFVYFAIIQLYLFYQPRFVLQSIVSIILFTMTLLFMLAEHKTRPKEQPQPREQLAISVQHQQSFD